MTGTYPDAKYPSPAALSLDGLDPLGLGYPCTVLPKLAAGNGSIVAVNRCYFMRWIGGGTISKLCGFVAVSSGNICLALYANNGGVGKAAAPTGAPIVTTGSIACPGNSTDFEQALGASYLVQPGDWVALACDNTTATFRLLTGGAQDSTLAQGDCYYQAAAFPCPTVGTLVASNGRPFVIVGKP